MANCHMFTVFPTKRPAGTFPAMALITPVTDNLQLTFGASHCVARDSTGRFNSHMLLTQFKLFTRFRVPMMPELTIGGGANWQNRTFQDGMGPQGQTRIYQGSYPLVNLFARYQVTK